MDQPYSNGVWYDVGNRDGIIVNNYIEGAEDGFFFEISRGATVAGNVFVRCNKGVRSLNSADVHVYNNTFIDTPAYFERDGRSATNDHFGWHPSTGPDVDQREGHIFVNNLLVASENYKRPLLGFEQRAFCDKNKRPQATQVDGNVYVRAAAMDGSNPPLIVWGPAENDKCSSTFNSVADFRSAVPGFEANGRQLDRTPRSILRGPDMGRYDLLPNVPVESKAALLPVEVRKILGWSEQEARTPGAYPVRQ